MCRIYKITMCPNTERTIRGYICHQLMHVDTPVIMEPTELTTMNKDLDVAPMLLQYQDKHLTPMEKQYICFSVCMVL